MAKRERTAGGGAGRGAASGGGRDTGHRDTGHDDAHDKAHDARQPRAGAARGKKENRAGSAARGSQHDVPDADADVGVDTSGDGDASGEPEVPRELPALPLKNTVLFPATAVPLTVGRKRSIQLLDDQMARNVMVGCFLQKDPAQEDPAPEDLHQIGCAAQIHRMAKMPDGSARLLVQGLQRIRLARVLHREPYLVAEVEVLQSVVQDAALVEALRRTVTEQFMRLLALMTSVPDEVPRLVSAIDDGSALADFVAANLELPVDTRQELLEELTLDVRLQRLVELLHRELRVVELGSKIRRQAQEQIEERGREVFLREQMRAIQQELGEGDQQSALVEELREKIAKAGMPDEVERTANDELKRLESIPAASPEYGVVRNYLEWLTSLPWSASTEDLLDIGRARGVLDQHHEGLDKIKDRILEYLSVLKLRHDMKGPILCFVGPPGVGKTSLGRAIAEALGRKFVRISLGGVRDEAEIRGHRRTYLGALPGRIVQSLRKAGSNNPVFMLDEVDKLGADFRGDPSSALLEVLDPEQNSTFSDHYLEVAFDLSRVLFIATANQLDTIPGPLRDRMEIIRLPGYIEEEKVRIARSHLVPRQVREHGLPEGFVTFPEDVLRTIIADYTRENGLRELERQIATVCRKIARRHAEQDGGPVTVKVEDLRGHLGPRRFMLEVADRTADPGVATGLAWTPTGGEILFVEATRMQGKGGFLLTGQIGDVMRESAQIALSCLRSRAAALGIGGDVFSTSDVHVHVPAGAVPKDGPSAGVAIVVALASLLTGRSVRPDVAMTGEITLRGKVMPVGGIKEKVLAARRAGINTVVLPEQNRDDLEEIQPTLLEHMTFRFVETVDAALELALGVPAARTKEAADAAP